MKIRLSDFTWRRADQEAALRFMNHLFMANRLYKADTGENVEVAIVDKYLITGFELDLSEFQMPGDEGAIELADAIRRTQDRRRRNESLKLFGMFWAGAASGACILLLILNT